jgi:hypothetical protein
VPLGKLNLGIFGLANIRLSEIGRSLCALVGQPKMKGKQRRLRVVRQVALLLLH